MQRRRNQLLAGRNISENLQRITLRQDDLYGFSRRDHRLEARDQLIVSPVRNNTDVPLFFLILDQFVCEEPRIAECKISVDAARGERAAQSKNLCPSRFELQLRVFVEPPRPHDIPGPIRRNMFQHRTDRNSLRISHRRPFDPVEISEPAQEQRRQGIAEIAYTLPPIGPDRSPFEDVFKEHGLAF